MFPRLVASEHQGTRPTRHANAMPALLVTTIASRLCVGADRRELQMAASKDLLDRFAQADPL